MLLYLNQMIHTTTVITICVAFVLVLVIGLNAGSGNALFIRLVHGGVSVPRRVISQEELTRFTTAGTSGEIVMIGKLGLLLDQGYQAINITTSDIVFYGGSTINTERVRIKGSNGNVGIGTTNPLSTLSVNGSGMFSGSVGIGTNALSGSITLHTSTAPTVPFGIGVSSYDNSAIVLGNVGTGSGFGALSFSYNPTVNTGYIGISGGSNTFWKHVAYGATSHSFYTANNIGTITNTYLSNPTLYLSSSGSVGIGTNSPMELFHVAGNMAVGPTPISNYSSSFKCYVPKSTFTSGSLTNPVYGNTFTIYSGDMSTANWGNTVTASQLYLRAGHLFDSTTTADNRTTTNYKGGSVYIMSGSVSLSNTSVTSTTYLPGDIIMTTGTSLLNKASTENSSGLVSSSDNERFRISGQTGYIGMGTNAPSANLHVYNPLAYTTFTTKIPSQVIIGGGSYTSGGTQNGRLYLGNLSDGNGTLSIIQSSLFNSFTNIDNGQNLAINPLGGNVGMGTTTITHQLNVYGNVAGEAGMRIQNGNNANTASSVILLQNEDTTKSCRLFINSSTRSTDGGANTATLRNDKGALRIQTSNIKGITIDDPNGNVTIQGNLTVQGTFSNSSDKRIKKNISSVTDSLTHLHSLRPVSFDYIDSTVGKPNTLGFIADEVKHVLPQSINYTKGFVPNILQSLPYQRQNQYVVITYSHPDMIADKKVKIIQHDQESIAHIISTTSSHITLQLDSIEDTPTLFLYGTEVDDFKAIDHHMIMSLTVSAVQELDKKYHQELSSMKSRMEILEEQMAKFK